MEEAGFDLDTIIRSVVIKGMNADDINTVIRNMDLDRYDNAYLDKMYDLLNDYED